MVTLANGLAEHGFKVDMVLAKAEGAYMSSVSKAVRTIDLKADRVSASLPGLIAHLRRERPQAMISAMNHANVAAYLATRWSGQSTRLIVSEHNTLSHAREQSRLKGMIVRSLMRMVYDRCHKIVAVSDGVADDLSMSLGLPRDRIQTIYNPIVSDDLIARSNEPVPDLAKIRRPVILAVGRLTAQKDYPTLLRAFSLLRETIDAGLVILGEGELRHTLEDLAVDLGISSYVLMPGFVGNPYAWMRHSDAFVMSSAWEGLPTVLVEAMACGVQIVSTDCPSGPREILEDGKWGRLVPVGDAQALANAISESLNSPTRLDLSARAQMFSVDRAIQKYIEFL